MRGGGVCHGTETMNPDVRVRLQRCRPDQLGQLARRAAARQIHLEKTVLRVEETRGAGHIGPARATHRRHAQPIALHAYHRGEAGKLMLRIQVRQACAQLPAEPEAAGQYGAEHDETGEGEEAERARHGVAILTARAG
jgi:hypothetical protein